MTSWGNWFNLSERALYFHKILFIFIFIPVSGSQVALRHHPVVSGFKIRISDWASRFSFTSQDMKAQY